MFPDSDPSRSRFELLEQFTHTDNGVIGVDAR
jgi:PAS domain S-box-containing protein